MERYRLLDVANARPTQTPAADVVPVQQVVVAASRPAAVAGGGAGVCGGEYDHPTYHRHGFAVQVRADGNPVLLEAALTAQTRAADWQVSRKVGRTLQGTVWVTQRRSRNERTALHRFNRRNRTNLYGLRYATRPLGVDLTLSGVRLADVETISALLTGAGATSVKLTSFTRAEAYTVLDATCAMRLMRGEGLLPYKNDCRRHKRFLIKDHVVGTMKVRVRSQVHVMLNVYRIHHGATYRYKVEVSIVGNTSSNNVFTKADALRLYAVLDGLVGRHQLRPLAKPDRWEPRERPGGFVRDKQLSEITWKAYRGPPVRKQVAADCHSQMTPLVLEIVCYDKGNPPSRISIRTTTLEELGQSIIENTGTKGRPAATCPRTNIPSTASCWREALKLDLQDTNGIMAELAIPVAYDEAETLRHLMDGFPNAGFASLSDGTITKTLTHLAIEHPVRDNTSTLVIWVDLSVRSELYKILQHYDAGVRHLLNELVPIDAILKDGELGAPLIDAQHVLPDDGHALWTLDVDGRWAWTTGMALDASLRTLRTACESSGITVLFVSHDVRPNHSGAYVDKHRYTDSLVRTMLGDAGRYWCHQRYLLQELLPATREFVLDDSRPKGRYVWMPADVRLVTIKDELEGRTGRIVYRLPRGGDGIASRNGTSNALKAEDISLPAGMFHLGGEDRRRSGVPTPKGQRRQNASSPPWHTQLAEIDAAFEPTT